MKQKIFAPSNELYGIDLSSSKQLNLLNEIVALLPEAPWANEQRAGLLYQYQNLLAQVTDLRSTA